MEVEEARRFIRSNHRAVLVTRRRDDGLQLSAIVATVDDEGFVVISAAEDRAKTRNLRRDPRAALCVMTDRFWGGALQVEGAAHVVSLPEAMDGLVAYYRSISGEHPDWDDYRRAMVAERRCLIRIAIERATG